MNTHSFYLIIAKNTNVQCHKLCNYEFNIAEQLHCNFNIETLDGLSCEDIIKLVDAQGCNGLRLSTVKGEYALAINVSQEVVARKISKLLP